MKRELEQGATSISKNNTSFDGSGEIIDVGEGVNKNRIGERVWIWNGAFEGLMVPAQN